MKNEISAVLMHEYNNEKLSVEIVAFLPGGDCPQAVCIFDKTAKVRAFPITFLSEVKVYGARKKTLGTVDFLDGSTVAVEILSYVNAKDGVQSVLIFPNGDLDYRPLYSISNIRYENVFPKSSEV